MNFEKVKFCNSHTQREKTVHMIVVGEGRKKRGCKRLREKRKNELEGRRETHSIILSKRKK